MKKILIIEDNHDLRENLQEILELSGYSVAVAANGVEGVTTARNISPDLILCDVMMPELDGYGVIRILHKDPKLMHIPFMFLTAKAEKQDFRKGMGLGADDYITKPFDDVELLDAIETRLKKSELMQRMPTKSLHHFYSQAQAQKALDALIQDREIRSYSAKTHIYFEGKNSTYIYYVTLGAVKCYKSSEIGKDLITSVFAEKSFVGLNAALTGLPYYDSVEVIEDTELALIPIQEFNQLLFNDRDFSGMIIKMLAHQVTNAEDMQVEMAFSSVRRKVALALTRYADTFDTMRFSLSREDLAALAGTAKETAIRTLSDFKSESLIDIEDGKIHILAYDKLKYMPQ